MPSWSVYCYSHWFKAGSPTQTSYRGRKKQQQTRAVLVMSELQSPATKVNVDWLIERWLIRNDHFLDNCDLNIQFTDTIYSLNLNVGKQEEKSLIKIAINYEILKCMKHCFLVSFWCRLPPRCLGEQRRATTGVWSHYEVLHQEPLAVHVWSSSLFSTQETKHRFGDVRNCWMCPPTLSVIS